jgi:hypothetical protein
MHQGPESLQAVSWALGELSETFDPYRAERRCANFVETPADCSAFFDAATVQRLERIKRAVDPAGVMHANHEITVGQVAA